MDKIKDKIEGDKIKEPTKKIYRINRERFALFLTRLLSLLGIFIMVPAIMVYNQFSINGCIAGLAIGLLMFLLYNSNRDTKRQPILFHDPLDAEYYSKSLSVILARAKKYGLTVYIDDNTIAVENDLWKILEDRNVNVRNQQGDLTPYYYSKSKI